MLPQLKTRLAGRQRSSFFDELPDGWRITKRYVIGTSARSGSTFLCDRICEYGALGYPNEFLNEHYVYEFERVFPHPSLSDYQRYLANKFSSNQGVFGLKADWWRFLQAQEQDFLQELTEPVDLIVHLWREDYVSQAISWVLAISSNVWHSRDLFHLTIDDAHAGVEYSADEIKRHARAILQQEYKWREYIGRTQTPSLDLKYEDVARDVDASVRAIAERLGVRELNGPPRRDRIVRSTSGVAEAWRRRFREECADFTHFWDQHRGLISAERPAD